MDKLRFTYLFVAAFIGLFAALPGESEARQQVGALWSAPDDSSKAVSQLNLLSDLGITHLELDHPISPRIQQLLGEFDLSVYINAGPAYFTLNEIAASQDSLLQRYIQSTEQYRSFFDVTALGLFRNSQTNHPAFQPVFQPILDSLQLISNKDWYYQNNREWYSLTGNNTGKVFAKQFFDHQFDKRDLEKLTQAITAENQPTILFLEYQWIDEAVNQYPPLKQSLRDYHQTGQWSIPFPKQSPTAENGNWLVFLLLILWGALAAKLKYFPYVRAFILRYFTAHRFYVDDILHYRERAGAASILMMLMHTIFTGMVCYILGKVLFSEAGLAALFHHYPGMAMSGQNYFSLFLVGMSAVLVLQVLTVFWLYLPAKNLDHFSQAANLYAPNFYLDYLIVTVMLTLYHADISSVSLLVLGGLFFFIWFASFHITAINISKTISSKPIYLLITIVLHIVSFTILALLLVTQTNILQVFDLALSL